MKSVAKRIEQKRVEAEAADAADKAPIRTTLSKQKATEEGFSTSSRTTASERAWKKGRAKGEDVVVGSVVVCVGCVCSWY